MEWNRKRVVLLVAWVASMTAACYLGGVIGFTQGYSTALSLSGQDAFSTTIVLRILRRGAVPEAIHVLENQLDGQIAASVFGTPQKSYGSPYGLWLRFISGNKPVEANTAALSEVLKYREEHPPVSANASSNTDMMKKLGAYRAAPR
jgi:hypothetical protein